MVKVWEPQATKPAKTGFLARHHYAIILVIASVAAFAAFVDATSPEVIEACRAAFAEVTAALERAGLVMSGLYEK